MPEALQRPADDGRQRAHDVACAERDADEDEQRAEPHRRDPAAGRTASEQALDQEREAREAHERGEDLAPAAARWRLGQRLVAHGRDRRHPCRPHGRDQSGDEGDADPHGKADDDRPPGKLHAGPRDAPSGRVEERAEPPREAQAAEQAQDGRGDAEHQSLGGDRDEHLTPRRAHGAQQRELAPALSH